MLIFAKSKMKQFSTPVELMESINAFRISRLILTAFELRVFDPLRDQSLTSAEVAALLGTDPRFTDRLMNALVGTGLLVKKDGNFKNSEFSEKFLVSSSPSFMSELGHPVNLWRTWNTLTDAVKSGRSLAETRDINDRGPYWLETFIAAMHARGVNSGKELASLLDLSKIHRTLDVGGGSGAFTFAWIEKNPELRGVILDLPNVIPITRKYIEAEGLTGKITTLEGNYLSCDFGKGFDLVLMSAILHINNPGENSLLVRKGADALKEGGQLVIMDHVMNDERTEPFAGAFFTLNMLVGTPHGDTYTEKEIRGWMKEAGLVNVRLMTAASGMQFMVGIKGYS